MNNEHSILTSTRALTPFKLKGGVCVCVRKKKIKHGVCCFDVPVFVCLFERERQ